MKFIALILISLTVCTISFSVERRKTKRRTKNHDETVYNTVKSQFIAAAAAADGVFLDQSWKQTDFMGRNSLKLQEAFFHLTPKASKTLGIDLLNLQERTPGVCAGMSVYFLNMMKISKEQTPASQANQRVEAEISLMGNTDFQNSVFMNSLELHNIYYTSNGGLIQMAALKNLAFEGPAQDTTIMRGSTSSIGESTKDVDLENQTKDIQAWLKAHHRTNSYIVVQTTKHAMAYVRISNDLKFFFDPNFGLVRFRSISKIAKFFEGLFSIPVLMNGYMPGARTLSANTAIRLTAFH